MSLRTDSLRFNVLFSVLAMGTLSIILAILATEIYRQFAIESQRGAIEKVIGLEVDSVVEELGRKIHAMGQSLQGEPGFRRDFAQRDIAGLERRLDSQFHQYFVTAGVLKPQTISVYDLGLQRIAFANAADQATPVGCEALRQRALSRKGARRLRSITDLCLVDGRPHFSVLMPIGGLRVQGYLEIVVDPVFSLRNLEQDLGMPLRISYVDGEAGFVSGLWPIEDKPSDSIASFDLLTASGDVALTVSMAQDLADFESRLRMTRNGLIGLVGLLGLMLGGLMLYTLDRNALIPLQRLGEQLASIRRDRTQLGKPIEERGNAEVRLLTRGFNEMTRELKSLYDMLLARQEELQSEVRDREQAQRELQAHRDQLEELVLQRTRDLAQARDAALEASQSKSRFLANMSHELRTPLNAVIGFSELLMAQAQQRGDQETADSLERIHTAGQHLLALINDILDLSKIEAGKMQLFEEWFSVPDLVRDVAETVRPLLERNGNRLHLRCAEDVGLMYADATKLRQILYNLLSNAGKFTRDGDIRVTVWCEHSEAVPERSGHVFFSVRDTGIGIEPDQLDAIFEAFSQADLSTTRKYGGTGLGLAITQQFTHIMGGGIHVLSEPGEGSTFSIMLPLKKAPAEGAQVAGGEGAADNVLARSQRLAGGRESAGGERRKRLSRVLVIDDDPAVLHVMSHFLSLKGYEVRTAASGVDGLTLAGQWRPDVITVDVMMPGMDGWAVLRALKESEALRGIPVVVVTLVEDRALAEALGAAGYMSKPIDKLRLYGIISRCVRADDPPPDGPTKAA